MADQNPRDDGVAVALSIPPGNLPFLRFLFSAGRDGAREDLDRFGEALSRPERRLREERIYGRLLDALEGSPLHSDREMVDFLTKLIEAIDRENEYQRVVGEHEALVGICRQVEEAVIWCRTR